MVTNNRSKVLRKKVKKVYTAHLEIQGCLIRLFYGKGNLLKAIGLQHKCDIDLSPSADKKGDWTLKICCRTRVGIRAAHKAYSIRLRNTLIVAAGIAGSATK